MTSFASTTTYQLGQHPVHRVGFGAMQLPGPGVFGPPKDHAAALAVLRRCVEVGVDHIDTAQFYGPAVSNELIREALHPYPDNLRLVSKVGARRDASRSWLPAQTPAELRADVEQNLQTLGVEQLAAVNLRLHDAEDGSSAVPLEDQLATMVALRDEGKIAGVGISNANDAQVAQAIESAAIVCVQNAYSLLDRSDEAVLERCRAAGVAYVPFFPLGSAFPQMPKVVDNTVVKEIAGRLAATPAQIGLAWLLAHAENILLIPGTSSLAHLEENLAVASVELTAEDLDRLDGVSVGSS